MPAMLKPAPTRLRLLLWSMANDQDDFAEAPPPGHVRVPASDAMPAGYYEMAGYARLGTRALRIDMLERLADLIRPKDTRGGFEATQDMLSITGCTLEQFADLMEGLGFAHERGERPKPVRKPAEAPDEVEAATEGEAAETAKASTEQPPAGPDGASDMPAPAADTPADAMAGPVVADGGTAAETVAGDDAGAGPAEPEPAAEMASDVEAAAPEVAAGDATETPASEESEVFFVFRLAPRERPQRGPRRPQGERGQHRREDGERQRADGKGRGQGFGGGKGKGKGPKGPRRGPKPEGGPRKMEARPPKKERPIDPDNPFAILQQLKSD